MEVTSASYQHKGRLKLVLWLVLAYLIAEVAGGILTGSLALLADAGHMVTDAGGLAFALFAINIARRPASKKLTYGYYRVEILAALTNAVVLIGISLYILYEAWQRFKEPPEVSSKNMLIVAIIGLLVNIAGMLILRKGSKKSLNLKGAYFEVLSDMLTSLGVIAAAVIMMMTGWYYADPIISAGIGLFILPRVWILLKDAVKVLLEGTPADISMNELNASLNSVPGVVSIHDLHVWSLTSGMNVMSAHVLIKENAQGEQVLKSIKEKMLEQFNIAHTTIQIEKPGFTEERLDV